MSKALVIVDVQQDFCPGGSLAVEGGDKVALGITQYMEEFESYYATIVATKCWHPEAMYVTVEGERTTEKRWAADFTHFSDTPDFIDTWPPHCIAGTEGARFHPLLDTTPIERIFAKGRSSAAYSGFEGLTLEGVCLKDHLTIWDVTQVDVVGIATDYCVKWTCVDASKAGFQTNLLVDLTAAVHPENTRELCRQLEGDFQITIT